MLNFLLQHIVAGKPDGIVEATPLQVLVEIRAGEGGIGPEVPPHPCPLIAGHEGLQHVPPVLGAMHIPGPHHRPLAVPKLVEAEQGVIAHGFNVAVVGRALLLAVYRALRAVHAQDDALAPGPSHR
jgi:hypothetical protein